MKPSRSKRARASGLPALPPDRLQAALREAAEHRVARRDEQAIALYQAIEARNPEAVDAPYFLALIDLARRRTADAAARLEGLSRRLPSEIRVWQALALAYKDLGRWTDSLSALDRALAIDPRQIQTERPEALQVLGRMSEAIAVFRAEAERPATRLWALSGLADLRPGEITEAERAELEQAARQGETSRRVQALFALGEVEEERERYDAAFAAFAEGNRLRRAMMTGELPAPPRPQLGTPIVERHPDVEAEQHRVSIAFRKSVLTADFFQSYAGRGHHIGAPIFVVGMPRSGSTLIEQILSSHRRVQGRGEESTFVEAARGRYPYDLFAENPPDNFRRIAEAYFKAMHERGWASAPRFVDKMLYNYMEIGLIHLALPKATILHAVRDPVDTCLACFRKNFQTGLEFSYDLGDLGREYVRYREMMDHWASVLPGRVIDVSHEALVADPEGQIRWLVTEACGLDWDDACLRFHETRRPVRTASVAQVRQPIFSTSLERWRRYEDHLGPLFEALGPYAPSQRPKRKETRASRGGA